MVLPDNEKEKCAGERGLLAFPGFPLILVVVKENIITVAATSFFSFKPPMIMVGIVPSRYTYELIQSSNDYTVNIPTEDLLPAVKVCGTHSGRNTDKWKLANLTPEKSKHVSSLMIKECPVSMECKITETIEVKESTHVWYVGEIVVAHIQKDYDRSQALIYWPREYRRIGSIIDN